MIDTRITFMAERNDSKKVKLEVDNHVNNIDDTLGIFKSFLMAMGHTMNEVNKIQNLTDGQIAKLSLTDQI